MIVTVVRWILLLFLFAFAIFTARADENVVQEFSGSGSTTTALFKVSGKWQVRWNARQVVSVAVMAQDGTIVAGAAGVLRGSLFVPVGGQYYLKVSDGTVAPAATTPPPADTNAAPESPAPPPADSVSWHLTVVELGPTVPAGQELTVYTPYFIVPDSVVAPAVAAPPPTLSDKQLHCLVTIKGDNATGGGFLMQMPAGTFVVTTLHLLAANPNLKIVTNAGAPVTITGFRGAPDRDLAIITVSDPKEGIPLFSDPAGIKSGDQVIVPAFNRRDVTLLGRVGSVVGVEPVQLNLDVRLGSNAEGAPVILVKGGAVAAMICNMKRSDLSESIAQAWSGNPAPGASGALHYSALRLTDIKTWENYDTARFQAESAVLKQFHTDTRCIDSYLNSRRFRSVEEAESNPHPIGSDYLNNGKLKDAIDTYKHFSIGADQNQRLSAAKELLFDLIGIADTDVSTLKGFTTPYTFNRRWAQEELAYRKALRKQLDDLGDNIASFDKIARTR